MDGIKEDLEECSRYVHRVWSSFWSTLMAGSKTSGGEYSINVCDVHRNPLEDDDGANGLT